jgi:thiamine monophosphate synthase
MLGVIDAAIAASGRVPDLVAAGHVYETYTIPHPPPAG